jgi:hypothetical protein
MKNICTKKLKERMEENCMPEEITRGIRNSLIYISGDEQQNSSLTKGITRV